MAKLEKHSDFNTVMFHSSKSAGLIYTLNQYVATRDETSIEGESFSVNYWRYKYDSCSEVKDDIVEHITEILIKNERLIKECNCMVSIPSNRLKPIIELVSGKLGIEYIDGLEKVEQFKIQKIEPISERKKKSGFIKCTHDFMDNDCIILIDDFVDSGTTFRECIRAIKNNNTNVNIVCISIFRTEKTLAGLE